MIVGCLLIFINEPGELVERFMHMGEVSKLKVTLLEEFPYRYIMSFLLA